jgi:nitrite reductase/ring-hydroxylating ferredoxin subunit
MAEPASPQHLCPTTALVDGGLGHVFDLLEYGQPARGFVVRFEGRVLGYLNRCAHVPAEMDWQPGRFFDDSGRWLVCAIHGAVYHPAEGVCVAGPCPRKRLQPLTVAEQDGQVYWYPSGPFQPVAFAD